MNNNLGEKIKTLRKNLNLSQGDMAEKIGISQPAYQRIEKGQVKVPRDIKKIATILETSPEYLLFDTEPDSIHLNNDYYEVLDSLMEPNFPEGTKITIDQERKPVTGNYVMVKSPLTLKPVLRQYFESMGECYLKTIGNLPAAKITSDIEIIGVAVKAEIDLVKK